MNAKIAEILAYLLDKDMRHAKMNGQETTTVEKHLKSIQAEIDTAAPPATTPDAVTPGTPAAYAVKASPALTPEPDAPLNT